MIPVASVVTQKSLKEFLLLKMSLEFYHHVEWFISTDLYAKKALEIYDNVTTKELIKTDDCSHGTNDPVKNRLFLELVMTKFEAMKMAISKHGYALFVDSDIFFTSPIEEKVLRLMQDQSIDAILSPHMTNNLGLETQVGHYNVGFFSMRNMNYLNLHEAMSWRHKELGMYYEQQPLQFSSYSFLTVNLPINYNIGWWRFNEKFTHKRLELLTSDGFNLLFDGKPAICFHVHAFKKLDYTNYGKFFIERIVKLMKTCKNDNYQKLIKFMEENSDG